MMLKSKNFVDLLTANILNNKIEQVQNASQVKKDTTILIFSGDICYGLLVKIHALGQNAKQEVTNNAVNIRLKLGSILSGHLYKKQLMQ